jgi:hypothetical protein
LAAKPFHMGVDVDVLVCFMYHCMVCGYQTRGQSFLSGAALSHHIIVGGGAFSRGVKPSGLDI